MMTVAPATDAPELSVTVPRIVPRKVCALTVSPKARNIESNGNRKTRKLRKSLNSDFGVALTFPGTRPRARSTVQRSYELQFGFMGSPGINSGATPDEAPTGHYLKLPHTT